MKACIFDLDGTLTDTLESLVYSVNESLREMGLSSISEEQCRTFVGNGARYLMESALKAAGDTEASRIEEGMQVYGRIFGENCTYRVVPYDGIVLMLEKMKARGMKLAVLSNKPHKQTVNVVETVFGKDMFAYIQGQSDTMKRKPEPDGVYYILDKLGVAKDECLYVGDSEVDVQTGNNAGLKNISVTWGFRSRELLENAGAEYVIDRPEELLQFVS